jgi:uncharacterized protein YndB with AHSA1/START domain
MDQRANDAVARTGDATESRRTERELIVTRTFDGPARLVFEAWTTPALLMRWWAPKSFGITFISCEADVRTGGTYRFVFGAPGFDQPMAFFGKYLEVIPPTRLVWTNEEGGDGGSVTTVTLTEKGGKTQLVLHDLWPSKKALDEAIASGSTGAYPEQFEELDRLLAGLAGDLRASA